MRCVQIRIALTHYKLGFPKILDKKPEGDELMDEQILRELHRLLLETQIIEGKLTCGNCGHEYLIKEGIANFLLPSHLGLYSRCLSTTLQFLTCLSLNLLHMLFH